MRTATITKKVAVGYRPMILSRHPSHAPLRRLLKRLPFRSVVRFGSTNHLPNDPHRTRRVVCNTVEAVKNASDKLRMKRCFQQAGVVTSEWTADVKEIERWFKEGSRVVMKHRFGSRGRGLYLLNNSKEVQQHLHSDLSDYIWERFYDFSREYRLHVTKDGCFYTNRKLLRDDVPDTNRWYRNDSNCSWILETNPSFGKPINWKKIEAECVKALKSVGLDVGALDVKVQSATDKDGRQRTEPKFVILEINSAPSHGDGTRARYQEIIPKILIDKYNAR